MGKKIFAASLLSLLLIGCAPDSSSASSTPPSDSGSNGDASSNSSATSSASSSSTGGEGEGPISDPAAQGVIFHAWNWSMNQIKDNLDDIKAAGFSTIQTSPMQPQKDFWAGDSISGGWWKLYQPLGMSVATKNNALGTKQDLIELCDEAAAKGMKIIVDVVTNHLAGGSGESFNSAVREYEPGIYDANLLHKGIGYVDDSNTKQLVRGHLGDYPDLMTEDDVVQQAILDMLKEYLDCGVNGFRFDAAKHIETPSDGEYASDYWPIVIGGIKEYAEETGKDAPFIYGEILNTPGNGRSIDYYTPYMDVTDTNLSWSYLNAVTGNNASSLNATGYGLQPNQGVLWGESHDTYANDSHDTTYIDQGDIDKAYALGAMQTEYTSLYFCRPENGAGLPSVGTDSYKGKAIASINLFHDRCKGSADDFGQEAGVAYSKKDGAVALVGVSSNEVSIRVDAEDGTYLDEVSGNPFVVLDGALKGNLGSSSIAVIYFKEPSKSPQISIDCKENADKGEVEVTISSTNADISSYSINGGNETAFDGVATFTLTGKPGDSFLIEAKASKGDQVATSSKTAAIPAKEGVVYIKGQIEGLDGRDLYAWVWGESSGRWVGARKEEGGYSFDIEDGDTGFLLAIFEEGVSPNWDDCLGQTEDLSIGGSRIYQAGELSWK